MNLDKDTRHQAMQVAAQTSGGNPIGIRDRALGRHLAHKGGHVKRSKASSRTIRRALAKQKKLEARQAKLNKGGFA